MNLINSRQKEAEKFFIFFYSQINNERFILLGTLSLLFTLYFTSKKFVTSLHLILFLDLLTRTKRRMILNRSLQMLLCIQLRIWMRTCFTTRSHQHFFSSFFRSSPSLWVSNHLRFDSVFSLLSFPLYESDSDGLCWEPECGSDLRFFFIANFIKCKQKWNKLSSRVFFLNIFGRNARSFVMNNFLEKRAFVSLLNNSVMIYPRILHWNVFKKSN